MKHTLLAVIVLCAGAGAADLAVAGCIVEDSAFETSDGGCMDLDTGLVWSNDPSIPTGSNYTWSFANNLCNGLTEESFTDWRLPSVAELLTVGANGGGTHLNLRSGTENLRRWTNQTHGNKAWSVIMTTGFSQLISKNSTIAMICVREP